MIELYVSGWGEDFMVEGTADEEAGTFTVVEEALPNPPTPMGRVVGDVVVNDFPISAISRSPLGDPPVWCWVFSKAT
jgi:hypothetical protein